MLITVFAGAALALAIPQATDTTFAVDPNARLEVQTMGGEIVVRGWDRNEIRIQADHSRRTQIVVRRTRSVVRLRARASRGPANIVDYDVTVPRSMSVVLSGTYTDIIVEGVEGEISAKTIQGNVSVTGGGGEVHLRSVQGTVTLEGATGRVDAHAVSEDVQITNVSGEIVAESVSGDVRLEGISSDNVDVGSVSGSIVYDGTLEDGGQYTFVTHSGNVGVSVAENANASFTVATIHGDIRSRFDLEATRSGSRRRPVFMVGTGSASVEIETFSGSVRFFRPGERRGRRP
jgi:DUF4097 and DUF4098 domain-containing protein YvlB